MRLDESKSVFKVIWFCHDTQEEDKLFIVAEDIEDIFPIFERAINYNEGKKVGYIRSIIWLGYSIQQYIGIEGD